MFGQNDLIFGQALENIRARDLGPPNETVYEFPLK